MTANRQQILTALAQRKNDIATRFGVRRLALFGSAARDELTAGSDVDLLVEFEGPATYDRYFGLKDHLEALLGRTVDLGLLSGCRCHERRKLPGDESTHDGDNAVVSADRVEPKQE